MGTDFRTKERAFRTGPWLVMDENNALAILISLFLEQVNYVENNVEKLVIWTNEPESMI